MNSRLELADFNIKKIDVRGWYVCKDGVNYLQLDGTMRNGVNGKSGGFWPSEDKAREALRQYIEDADYSICKRDALKAIEELKLCFTSGNGVPVDRATILAKDFWRIVGASETGVKDGVREL